MFCMERKHIGQNLCVNLFLLLVQIELGLAFHMLDIGEVNKGMGCRCVEVWDWLSYGLSM